jgi:hypothetical protein
MNPQVSAVSALPEQRLLLTFSNGERRVFDVKPYLSHGVFQALRKPEVFGAAKVVAGSVEWPGEIDLSYDTLYLRSIAEQHAA